MSLKESNGMTNTPPSFQGDRLTRFRFDLLPVTHAGHHLVTVLLTAETETGEVFDWVIGQPLADKWHKEMISAMDRLEHSVGDGDPAISAFLNLPLLDLMPIDGISQRAGKPQVVHQDAWPEVYIFDVTCTDDVTRRISLPPGLAAVFASQLGETLAEISNLS